ncbi:hypothetical protein KIW84_010067 [Lathyrus oleraceus]|uniref:Peptidase S26 domain-containing protein n=1 Tax=Pisum sativum TaxID=3888 RepID=A0A9D4YJV6_PEA|nr:hypothetical protein KIW84_010067 [Pisum sativum]
MTFMNNIRSATKEALDRTAIIAKFLCCLHFTANYLCSPTHVFIPFAFFFFFFFFVFFVFTIDSIAGILCLQAYGPSMLPTLNIAGDVVLVEHISPRIGKIGHGDLVLVRSPLNPNRNLTKRVVAMEGDTVTFFDASHSDSSRTAVVCLLNECGGMKRNGMEHGVPLFGSIKIE